MLRILFPLNLEPDLSFRARFPGGFEEDSSEGLFSNNCVAHGMMSVLHIDSKASCNCLLYSSSWLMSS
jgi:hypothetical protein